jgi:hypothetical protein
VQLQLSKGSSSLYCHSSFLSLASGVLRNVLEDTQPATATATETAAVTTVDSNCSEQKKISCIPLDDSVFEISTWQIVLSRIYHQPAVISMDNAGEMLLLAHKYEMPSITRK